MTPLKAPGSSGSVPRPHKNFWLIALACLAVTVPEGCSWISPSHDRSQPEANPGARREQLKTDLSADEARALSKPPSGNEASVNNVALDENGLKGMQPAHGLNSKRLFSEPLRDDDARFARLEDSVQQIRDEMDTMSPSINRLVGVEKDIQDLVGQLNTLVKSEGGAGMETDINPSQLENGSGAINHALGVDGTGAVSAEVLGTSPTTAANGQPAPNGPPASLLKPGMQGQATAQAQMQTPSTQPIPAPRAAPPPPPPIHPAPAASASAGGMKLLRIRAADSPGKTRIVLETGALMNFKPDLDNGEHILTLTFDKGDGAGAAKAVSSKLIKSVNVTPQSSGGFVMAFSLTKDSKIIGQGRIGPGAGNPANRIFIDLAN